MAMRGIILVVVAMTLAACTTPMREARLKREAQQCEAFGFQPGTDAYANCRMQFELKHKQEAAEFGQSIGNAVSSSYGGGSSSAPQPKSVYCTSRQSYPGATVQTMCY